MGTSEILTSVLVVTFSALVLGDLSESELITSMRTLQLPAVDAEDFYAAHTTSTGSRFRVPRAVKFEDDKTINKKSAEAISASFGIGPQGLTGSLSAAQADGEKTKGYFGGYPGVAGGYYPPPGAVGGYYPRPGYYPGGSSSAAAAAASSNPGFGGGGIYPVLGGGIGGGPISHSGGSSSASASSSGSNNINGGGIYPGAGGGFYPGGGIGNNGYYPGGAVGLGYNPGGYPGGQYGLGYNPQIPQYGYPAAGGYYRPNYIPHGGLYGGQGYQGYPVGGQGFYPGGIYDGYGYGGFRKGDGSDSSSATSKGKIPPNSQHSLSKPTSGGVTFKDN